MGQDAVPLPEDLNRPPTRAELVDVCKQQALDGWVRQFVQMIQLAAELYPEELRTALGYVFDVSAAEERLGQIAVLANRVDQETTEARMLAEQVTRQIEEDLGRVSDWAEQLARRYAKAHGFLTKLAEMHKRPAAPAAPTKR